MSPHALSPAVKPLLIVWNVQQGLWVTVLTERTCFHFDMGGEKIPPPVYHWCRQRKNELRISHGDQDHIQFLAWAARALPNLCLAAAPLDNLSQRKKERLSWIKPCLPDEVSAFGIREITALPAHLKSHDHNLLSRVFIFETADGSVLLPGDSVLKGETLWLKRLRWADHVRILVLGHHGSRTSTGDELLEKLPDLTLAIASARNAKYGHPHPEVVRRLLNHQISVLKTEDFGHIAIRL